MNNIPLKQTYNNIQMEKINSTTIYLTNELFISLFKKFLSDKELLSEYDNIKPSVKITMLNKLFNSEHKIKYDNLVKKYFINDIFFKYTSLNYDNLSIQIERNPRILENKHYKLLQELNDSVLFILYEPYITLDFISVNEFTDLYKFIDFIVCLLIKRLVDDTDILQTIDYLFIEKNISEDTYDVIQMKIKAFIENVVMTSISLTRKAYTDSVINKCNEYIKGFIKP